MGIGDSLQIFFSFFNSKSFFYLHQTEQLTQDSVMFDQRFIIHGTPNPTALIRESCKKFKNAGPSPIVTCKNAIAMQFH